VAIGDNEARMRIVDRLDLEWVTVVHPFTWVAPGVRLGRGAFVGAGAVVQPSSDVGEHAILNSRAGIGHDAIVEPFAHLSVAYLGSGGGVGEGALLAIGRSVLPGGHVGRWATVGAGAVVTRAVVSGTTVLGVPARPQPVLERA
jgi:acetyltransferase-like isoleucine patch superfamily enzyme